jgi:hypothetical protein
MANANLVELGSIVFTGARRWPRIVPFVAAIWAPPAACAWSLVACTHASPEPDPPRATEIPSAAPPSATPRSVATITAAPSAAPPPPTPAAVPATASGAPVAVPATASGAPVAPEPIVVSIDALPASAKIFLDGVALATNPYEAERPRDTRSHSIRIEAAGYKPQSSRVAFSGPVHTHVELVPVLRSAQTASP